MSRVTIGHLRVTVGHLRATLGHLRVTIGYLRVTIGHPKVTIGHLRVTIGYLVTLTLSCRWVDISTWTPPPQDCLYLGLSPSVLDNSFFADSL